MFGDSFGDSKRKRFSSSGPRNYEAMYNEISKQFWDLQQIKQTPEEEGYEALCKELEGMLVQFRDEINILEKENQDLQSKLENFSEIRQKYQDLVSIEENLVNLKRSLP